MPDLLKNLFGVLDVLEPSRITLNRDKCEFFKETLTFYGLSFSKDGVPPTEDRCRAFKEAEAPVNASELQSLLASLQFSSRFIEDLATLTEPLRRLTKTGLRGSGQRSSKPRSKC